MVDKEEFNKQLEEQIEQATNEELLEMISKFIGRVEISSQFGETDEGILTHIMLVLQAGDSAIVSDPMEFEWPLQRMPMPDALRGVVN